MGDLRRSYFILFNGLLVSILIVMNIGMGNLVTLFNPINSLIFVIFFFVFAKLITQLQCGIIAGF